LFACCCFFFVLNKTPRNGRTNAPIFFAILCRHWKLTLLTRYENNILKKKNAQDVTFVKALFL
jgi:hypothetical protein